MKNFMRVAIALVLGAVIATPVFAVTLTSGMLVVDGFNGEQFLCTLVNAGTKPLTDVSIRLFDDSGNEIPAGTNIAGPLAPGHTYEAETLSGGFGYCVVTFTGSKKSARATLMRWNGAATLASVPVQ